MTSAKTKTTIGGGDGRLTSVVIFVDESQDNRYFVLGAVASADMVPLTATVGRFRTIARHLNITNVAEFHERDLHHHHPRLLNLALEEMTLWKRKKRRPVPRKDLQVVATYYLKSPSEQTGTALLHQRMLDVYRETFRSLVWALPLSPQETVHVVCDRFEGCKILVPDLKAIVMGRASGTVDFADSLAEKPLQLADLVVGTLRRHLSDEPNEGRFRYLAPLLYHMGNVSVRQ